jgi:type I restriction enzyme S subunit
MVLRPNERVMDKGFFPLFISSDYFLDAAIKISVGSLSPTINWRALKELEFELPSINKQQSLAAILWAAIETQNAYKRLLVLTEQLVKSRFIEMFGDIESTHVVWDAFSFGELFNLQMGKTPTRDCSEYWWSQDNKWITISDLSNYNKYTLDTKEYISNTAVQKCGVKIVPVDTVIMSFKLSIGKTAITSEPIYTNEAIFAFINKSQRAVNNEYLYAFLSFKNWNKGTKQAVKGITLNKETMSNMLIGIPPIELQNRFADFVRQVDKSKFITLKQVMLIILLYNKIQGSWECFMNQTLSKCS